MKKFTMLQFEPLPTVNSHVGHITCDHWTEATNSRRTVKSMDWCAVTMKILVIVRSDQVAKLGVSHY